ncbi:MAG: N-acetyltransferase [Chloroflexi bacterium]|nr:MAG: N-acetyltransferase [Chloroflexota bacterium]
MANRFDHPTALVETDNIGDGTRIWAFAHILKGAVIGAGCNIGDHCFVESGVVIGNDVVVKNGVALWQGITLQDRVFIGPNEHTWLGEGASIGANATLLCGITIGRYALIGAGSVVTRDVPAFALVYGNPARQHGWACMCGNPLPTIQADAVTCPQCQRAYKLTDARLEFETC